MEKWQLKQRQSLPLEAKVVFSLQRIREWYEHYQGQVYVSFSGGKDSTVLLHLVRSLYPDVPAVFCDTGLEYPEIRDFVKTVDNVVWLKPGMSFVEVIKKHGYPVVSKSVADMIYRTRVSKLPHVKRKYIEGFNPDGTKSNFYLSKLGLRLYHSDFKISAECCRVMKKAPSKRYARSEKRFPYLGLMAGEGHTREVQYLKYGCNAFDLARPRSTPLAIWTEDDIWEYIRSRSLPYSRIYDMGYARTGCMWCGFGVHLESSPNRFERMKHTHPKLWEYCMFKLGLKDILDFMGVPWGMQESLFEC